MPPTTAAPPTTLASATTESPAGRRAPDAPAPDDPCRELEIRTSVFVVLGRAQSLTGCTRIAPSQRILVANYSAQTLELVLGAHRIDVAPTDRNYTEAGRASELLAPGVHLLGGRQYWLVDEPPMRFASTTIEMGRFGTIALGMTVREVEMTLGGKLLINPRFATFDGHPLPNDGRAIESSGIAYFDEYDGSVPLLWVRANGPDPLDAVVIWITPAQRTVPSAVRVGWTEDQVRAVYGTRIVEPQSLTCPLPNQKILVVFDGAPVTGTPRLWITFEDGRLASASTSSVTLGETGVMDC